MVDRILEESYLFDFYGELLTEHQRQIYEQVVLEDLSLGEAAENFGISRQAVYDLLKRSRKQLSGYEEKLHLVARFLRIRDLTRELTEELVPLKETDGCGRHIEQALSLTRRITEEL